MRAFQWPKQRGGNKPAPTQASATPFYAMWDAVARFAQEIRASDFMTEMVRRRDAYGSEGVMGALDCATLYALTRWLRAAGVGESGGAIGRWSCRGLEGLADAQLKDE